MKQKQRYKLMRKNKITLQYYGTIDDLNICYYIKLTLPITPLKKAFYKNIATNDDY